MASARAFRGRALRLGATAALTLAATGVITAATTSAASADVICSYAYATSGTLIVRTTPICMTTTDPYNCNDPDVSFGTLFEIGGQVCVID
jgi:hypothetical protein